MNETIGNALVQIAEKAGHGVEYVYPLMVKAQVALGIRDAIVPLASVATR